MYEHKAGRVPGLRPLIVARLRPDWRLVDGVCFIASGDEEAARVDVEAVDAGAVDAGAVDEGAVDEGADDEGADDEGADDDGADERVDHKEVDIVAIVPPGSRVEYRVPQLQERESMTEAEETLARYIQIVLPKGLDPTKFIESLRELPCFEDVSEPPEISLPGAPGAGPFAAPLAPPSAAKLRE